MYIVKVGTMYLTQDGTFSDAQCEAARFDAKENALLQVDALNVRAVKLKTRADATADSMRGLAGDILDNGNS